MMTAIKGNTERLGDTERGGYKERVTQRLGNTERRGDTKAVGDTERVTGRGVTQKGMTQKVGMIHREGMTDNVYLPSSCNSSHLTSSLLLFFTGRR